MLLHGAGTKPELSRFLFALMVFALYRIGWVDVPVSIRKDGSVAMIVVLKGMERAYVVGLTRADNNVELEERVGRSLVNRLDCSQSRSVLTMVADGGPGATLTS